MDLEVLRPQRNVRLVIFCLLCLFLALFILIMAKINPGTWWNYSMMTIIFVPLLKFFESILIFRIELNPKNNSLIFSKSFGKVVIKREDIEYWTLRKMKKDSIGSSSLYPIRYFECKLKNEKVFVYPLTEGLFGKQYSDSFFLDLLGKTLGVPAKESDYMSSLIWKSGLSLLKYDFAILLL